MIVMPVLLVHVDREVWLINHNVQLLRLLHTSAYVRDREHTSAYVRDEIENVQLLRPLEIRHIRPENVALRQYLY